MLKLLLALLVLGVGCVLSVLLWIQHTLSPASTEAQQAEPPGPWLAAALVIPALLSVIVSLTDGRRSTHSAAIGVTP